MARGRAPMMIVVAIGVLCALWLLVGVGGGGDGGPAPVDYHVRTRGEHEERVGSNGGGSPPHATALLPPGARWTEQEARSVVYQNPEPPQRGKLDASQVQSFLDRCRKAGYSHEVDVTTMPPTIARVAVRSELILSRCDVRPDADAQRCAVVDAVRREVGLLDKALISDPVLARKHHEKPPKVGQGYAARGWGIAGPFTNKWTFYERHLRTAAASPHRADTARGVHLCEVGFLAGHSTAVFSALLGHDAFASVSIFDLPQPGTRYSVVGMRAIRERFRVASPATQFDFYATLSREGITAAIGSGRMNQCDFVSLDGSKLRGDVIQDFRLFSHIAHPGTVVVCDDVWTSKVLAAAAPTAAQSLEEHNVLMGAMITLGMIELAEVWHSDVVGWPAYGNLAFRFKLFGKDFDEAADRLMQKINPKYGRMFAPAPLDPDACGTRAAWPLLALHHPQCCAATPVNELAHARPLQEDFNAQVTLWDTMRAAIETCVEAPAVDAATTPSQDDVSATQCTNFKNQLAESRVGLVNPYDHGAQLLVWAAQRTRIASHGAICIVDPPSSFDSNLIKVVGLAAARRANGESASVLIFSNNRERLPSPPLRLSLDNCKMNRVESHYLNSRYPAPSLQSTCGVTIVDCRDADATTVKHLEALTNTMAGMPSKAYSMIVLRNVNAAGIIAAFHGITLDNAYLRRWPNAAKGLRGSVDDELQSLARQSNTSLGPLRPIEAFAVHYLLAQKWFAVNADISMDPRLQRSGTLIVTAKNFKLMLPAAMTLFGMSAVTDSVFGPPL